MSIRRLVGVILLVVSIAVTSSPRHSAHAATTSGLFNLDVTDGVGSPFGCIGASCPTEQRKVFAFSKQLRYPELAKASKIATVAAFNGQAVTSGCAIISSILKCFGSNGFGRLGDGSTRPTTDAFVTSTRAGSPIDDVEDVAVVSSTTCIIRLGEILCVGLDESMHLAEEALWKPTAPPEWFSMPSKQAMKIRLFNLNKPATSIGGYGANVPFVCALFSDKSLGCSWVMSAPRWVFFSVGGIEDFGASYGASATTVPFCFAGKASGCSILNDGEFGAITKISGVDGAESVYYQGNVVAFYRQGALWAVPQRLEGYLSPHLVGYMPKPLAFLWKPELRGLETPEQVLILPNGFMSVPTTALSCDTCATNAQGALTPLSYFLDSNKSTFTDIISVSAITDSLDFVPVAIETGARSGLVTKTLRATTESGEPVANAAMTWRSADAAEGVTSTIESGVTNSSGYIKVTAPPGPLTLSIVGGSVPSGAALQGAFVRVRFGNGELSEIKVPNPNQLVERRVTVVDSNGNVVPNAEIKIQNSYLAYTYSFADLNTATWGAQPPDPRGFILEPRCVWCFVPPPAFITGVDGSVTFRTFATPSRTIPYDAEIGYDDGNLTRSVKYTFTSLDDTVILPEMPSLVAQAADSSPQTFDIDIAADSSGQATVSLSTAAVSSGAVLSARVEDVCTDMETGSLWSEKLSVDDLCGSGPVKVSSMAAKCSPTKPLSISAGGKVTVSLCASSSKRVRIRALGAVPARSVCIVVRNLPCPVHKSVAGSASAPIAKPKTVRKGSRTALTTLLRPSVGTTVAYSATKPCAILSSNLVAPSKAGACLITKREVANAKSLRGASSVAQAVIVIK